MSSSADPAGSSHHREGRARRLRRSRRDRRGRGPRGPVLPPGLPAARTRAQQFDALVVAAVRRLEARWAAELADVDVAVEEVPPSDPAAWEGGAVPLARVFPADGGHRARLVVYRRPVEQRADDDLPELVRRVVVEQVAELLARAPEDVDPDYDPD